MIRGTTEHKVLGVTWTPSTDKIVFDVQAVVDSLENLEPTKRGVVGAAARIYDPLGALSPITINFKIFFQHLCLAKLGWDDILTGELLHQWKTLTTELRRLNPTAIPCCFPGMGKLSHQLIGFCDASQSAYAAVVYMRVVAEDTISTTIPTAKTRVAPLKPVTIPRLELLSALLLARLIHSISHALQDEVQLDHPICFIDSETTLCWIRHVDKEWKLFVENRVSEVRRLTPPEYWQHCPGMQNPADLPSSGLNPHEFEKRLQFWLQGPDWLKLPLCFESDHGEPIPDECLSKLRNITQKTLLTNSVSEQRVSVVNIEDFSSFKRLLRVMSQVFCFIRLTRHHERRRVSAGDAQLAHNFLICTSQATLIQNTKFKSWTQQFGLYKDNQGLFRCRGRLSNANLSPDAMFPIFLEKGDVITTLIVKDCHERVGHGGVSSTLAELRSKYWDGSGSTVGEEGYFQLCSLSQISGQIVPISTSSSTSIYAS